MILSISFSAWVEAPSDKPIDLSQVSDRDQNIFWRKICSCSFIFALAPFTFECAKSACPLRYVRYVRYVTDFPRFLPKEYACGTPPYAYRCFETWFLGVSKSSLHVWSFQERYLCPQGPLFWPSLSVLFAWKIHFFSACSEHVSRWKTEEMVLCLGGSSS